MYLHSNFTALKWTETGLLIDLSCQRSCWVLEDPLHALFNQRIDIISHKLDESNGKRGYTDRKRRYGDLRTPKLGVQNACVLSSKEEGSTSHATMSYHIN